MSFPGDKTPTVTSHDITHITQGVIQGGPAALSCSKGVKRGRGQVVRSPSLSRPKALSGHIPLPHTRQSLTVTDGPFSARCGVQQRWPQNAPPRHTDYFEFKFKKN